MKYTFIGSATTVGGLQSFLDDIQVDEIMVASYVLMIMMLRFIRMNCLGSFLGRDVN